MPRIQLALAAFLLLTGLTATAGDFVARFSSDLRTVHVEACFTRAPTSLRAGDRAANGYLGALSWQPGDAQPQRRGNKILLNANGAAGCLNYQVDVGRAADDQALRRTGWAGADLLTTPELWLWRDVQAGRLQLALPDGVRASVPWPGDGDANTFRLDPTPRQWAAQMAVGQLHTTRLPVPGGVVRLAIADVRTVENRAALIEWVTQTTDAISQIHGSFPRRETQILIIPGAYDSVVPWGQVLRGGAPAVQFYVARDATLDTLRSDWTAFHELSHLFLPFVQRSDAYFSEGFASYFQNLTRGRSANLTPEKAWGNLYAGFERGRRDTQGHSLQSAAKKMGRGGHYMRVYWSGAALALLGDVALREQTGQGLDQLLGELRDCCLDDHKAWSATRLAAQLDRLSNSNIFTTLNARLAPARTFPDVTPALERLGVKREADTVKLDDDAPLAAVRRAIMTPATVDSRTDP